MKKKERIDFYEKSLERVNVWLQFAEAKHGAIIAFAVAVLAVIYEEKIELYHSFKVLLSVGYVISISISLISFLPIFRVDTQTNQGRHLEQDNMCYWKDICKYSTESYVKRVNREIFEKPNRVPRKVEKLLADEIIANARIANKKYILFRYSIFILAFVTILLPVFLMITA